MKDEVIIPGLGDLRARRFEGRSDYEAMSRISQRSWLADGFEWIKSAKEIEASFVEIRSWNPEENLVFIEAGDEVIGYGEFHSEQADAVNTSFLTNVHILPEWRGKGIREVVLRHIEGQLLEHARKSNLKGFFETWANEAPNEWRDVLLRDGFEPHFYVLEMSHSSLDQVPEHPLPAGIEVRQVPPEKYRDVWEGMRTSFRNEPWFSEELFDEDHFKAWMAKPNFEPGLWQTAWDGDRIVGNVQNFINTEENQLFGKRVGHTEEIWVAQDWQRKGVAKAIISRSLRHLAKLGMTEASLDMNAHNISGALQLYTSLGYKPVHQFVWLRKPLPPTEG